MKREWNQSAYRFYSTSLQYEKGMTVVTEEDRKYLITLKRLSAFLMPKSEGPIAQITAITRSSGKKSPQAQGLQEEMAQKIRIRRIGQAQDEERWILNLNYI